MLNPAIALMQGIPTKVCEAVADTSGGGVGFSHSFSIVKTPGPEAVITLQAIGTFTVLKGNIESSLDGGTTWSINIAFDFISSPIFIFNVTAGVLYRLNFGTVTKTVSPDVLGSLA